MSQLSRFSRLRKRRERTLTPAQRRRKLVAGFEALEDRRLLAIDTDFTAGVLTFTGDFGGVSNDRVVIESTGTPGTINYDDGTSLSALTQTGVNKVVFNAGGGMNEMVVINKGLTVFRRFDGLPQPFDVQFNVANDPDFDVLRIAGGDTTTISTGSYTVTNATDGKISYSTTVPSTIDISYTGLNSTGGTPDQIDDFTIQNQAPNPNFTVNSSTGSETVTVKVGPDLAPVQAFTQGPVVIDGGDRDQHGFFDGSNNRDGWQYIQQLVEFVEGESFIQDTYPGASGILALGAKFAAGTDAREAIDSAAAEAGIPVTHVDTPAGIAAVNFNLYKLIYVPSNEVNTPGGITGPELDALILRKAQIQTYVRQGGGIVALTDADTDVAAMGGNYTTREFYGWLEIPDPFTILDFGAGGISDQLRKTQAAIDAGLTITDGELTNGIPYHNTFTGPAGFNGLDVFVMDRGANGVVGPPSGTPYMFPAGDDRAVALGQGAINDQVGGGKTTQISGSAMTTINIGHKLTPISNANRPFLKLDTRGGNDAITVDGSATSLDFLLPSLTVVGGGSPSDSLSITDSADNTGPGDNVSVTSLATTGLAAQTISYSGIGSLSVQATQGADTMTLDFSAAGPTSVSLFGGAGGDTFTGPLGYMRASSAIQINVHGDTAAKTTGPVNPSDPPINPPTDKFNLDMTNRADGSAVTPVVIVDTNGGNATSTNTLLVRFTGIEDIDVLDGGVLTNTAIRDFYIRGTGTADYIEFRSAAQMDPTFRVRVGNTYYPSSTGNFGPYTTSGPNAGKAYIYGRDGKDTITMYNTRLDAVIFGEGGDDVLTGGYGNDLIIGGAGNDRINGAAVGGDDEIWGDDFDPQGATLATRSAASQTGTGNDQINTFGGDDTVYGQGGADIINTGLGADYINGGPGNDLIDGQGGDDRIYAGTGNDTASGAEGNDLVAGNDGDDTLLGRIGNDILIGGDGIDTVNGHEGGDALIGDDSNNAGGSNSLAKSDTADAALLAVLNAWKLSPVLLSLSGLASSGTDSDTDTLWGGSEADAFFATGLDVVADRVVGTDLN